MRRLLPFLALAALLAGCGSSSTTSSSGGSIPAGAHVIRAGVLAFVAVDSDTGSDQWQQLDKLAQKFPGRDKAVAQLEQKLTAHGVDYEHDVKPALGPELDVAAVSGGTNASTAAVALTKPDDPDKLKALVAKLNAKNGKVVYREVDGWYALSNSQDAITQALQGNGPLADDPDFKQAMGKLPGDALAKVYVDGQRLNEIVKRSASQSGSGLESSALGLDKLKYFAVSASAEDDGVRLKGASSGGPAGSADFASALLGGVPSDAFAFVGFDGQETADQIEQLEKDPQAAAAFAQVERVIGVSYDQVLSSLLGGEVAFYARAGVGIPELTLALAPKDASAALKTLDTIAAHLAARSGGHVESGTQGGHAVKTLNLGNFAVHYGSVDGKVLITSGPTGIADYGQGDHLSDSADFKEAKDAAGMPDSTGGFLYVDVKDALPLLEGLASLSGRSLPSSTTDNLRPLRSVLAWSNASGETRTFDAFLEIK
jgi:ABC-type glycerol-3-phosphate transport system substrate-binding protein